MRSQHRAPVWSQRLLAHVGAVASTRLVAVGALPGACCSSGASGSVSSQHLRLMPGPCRKNPMVLVSVRIM